MDGDRAHRSLCGPAAANIHSGGIGVPRGGAAGSGQARVANGACVGATSGTGLDLSGRARECIIGHGPETGSRRREPIARKPAPPAAPGTAHGAKETKRRAPTAPAALKEAAKTPGTARKKAVAAGPRGKREEPADGAMLAKLQAVIVESLEADKAEEVVAIDLAGRASFADRMVIATGLADRQISAMATHLEDRLGEAGVKRVRVEGAGGSDWVLIDAGDIVIHLFKPDARALYALEKMWGADFDDAAAQNV